MPTDQIAQFRAEMLELARLLIVDFSLEGADATPADLCKDLRKLDTSLTRMLQTLQGLRLEHKPGQDIESEPYNWKLAQTLDHWGSMARFEARRKDAEPLEPAYPTALVRQLEELRNTVRIALKFEKPQKGNAAHRTVQAARREKVGKNFVFRYRCRFREMPPMSKTGWEVELLQEMLRQVGADGVDAADVLRRAIERDEAGRKLPKRTGGSNRANANDLKRRQRS